MPTDAHVIDAVTAAYTPRAAEYAEQLGSMATAHPSDVQLVTDWAIAVDGPVLDAGCGPGHWTAHLVERGVDARGVDLVPSFIAHARAAYPAVTFDVESIDALSAAEGSLGGVLAWYSLIHHDPRAVGTALAEFARVLRPGGRLLVGFFHGDVVESFDHAVVTAYRWPAADFARELHGAGFDVIETHTRTGAAARPRPHCAIVAELRGGEEWQKPAPG